ncbi:energy transducer TonB [Edaphobacter sp. HDX4]|uniref:energy transducer TonB n=1 Tax=Edaphobacter sp. HDX4 TaxID=2794064 RepID=UPI002FE69E91
MQTGPKDRKSGNRRRGFRRVSGGSISSVLLHGALLALLIVGYHRMPRQLKAVNPGISQGTRILPYLAVGSLAHSPGDHARAGISEKKAEERALVRKPLHQRETPTREAPKADMGISHDALAGAGAQEVVIALPVVHPRPKPDLSLLPDGTGGDIILNAVIDEKGAVTELVVVKSLGERIDSVVLATVRQWSFTPATVNGRAISSEQEIHFHYASNG